MASDERNPLTVFLPVELYDQLIAEAEEAGLTLAQYAEHKLRELLHNYDD